MIYQNFLSELKKKKKNKFSQRIIIHGGGWKKLSDLNISTEFQKTIKKILQYK